MNECEVITDAINGWKKKMPLMQFQVARLIREAILNGQGELWLRRAPDFYSRGGIMDLEDPDNEYTLEKLREYNTLFESGDWEIVCSSGHNWFDEGGDAVDILIANKKAQTRVWDRLNGELTKFGYVIPAVFWEDFSKFPEDYILLTGGPR